MNKWLSIALTSGLFPLTTGTLVFALWWLIRAEWLVMLGLFILLSGLVLFVFGLIAVTIYFVQSHKQQLPGYRPRAAIALAILLVNFPVATGIIYGVEHLLSFSTVIIDNQSSFFIDDITLQQRDKQYRLGALAANSKLEKAIPFKYQASVNYSFNRNSQMAEGILFGYITGMGGQVARITIARDGKVTVQKQLD